MKSDNSKVMALLAIGEIDNYEEAPWPNYVEKYQFKHSDIHDLITLVTSNELNTSPASSTKVWAPLHAWRALGQLKAAKAVEPIIQFFDRFTDDDSASEELPKVFGMIGEPAIEPLANHLQKPANKEFSHMLAISGLATVVAKQDGLRAQVLEVFKTYMQSPWKSSLNLNGSLIGELINLEAVEFIEEIRYLFKLGCVDLSYCGDIEDVEIELGLRHERQTPRPDLYGLDDFSGLGDLMQKASQGTQDDVASPLSGNNSSSYTREAPKVGRNDPCPCNSGKKFKKCCGSNK